MLIFFLNKSNYHIDTAWIWFQYLGFIRESFLSIISIFWILCSLSWYSQRSSSFRTVSSKQPSRVSCELLFRVLMHILECQALHPSCRVLFLEHPCTPEHSHVSECCRLPNVIPLECYNLLSVCSSQTPDFLKYSQILSSIIILLDLCDIGDKLSKKL